MVKWGLIGAWLALLTSAVCGLFWYNDWVFQLPTPVPINYHPVALGSSVDVTDVIQRDSDKPLFLHFYNPDCACSRFNKAHFQSIVRSYGKEAQFAVVVMTDKKFTTEEIQEKIGLKLPVYFNQDIAKELGVYSTPQAAILDKDQKLYYRGNYNASRYCSDEKTAFAKQAISSLLLSESLPAMTALALKSYGCSLPVCKN